MRVEELIDQLEARIRDARETPLIGGARLDRWEINDLLDEIAAELSRHERRLDEHRVARRGAGVWDPMGELFDVVVASGSGDRVRVDRDRLLALVRRMKEGVAREDVVTRSKEQYDPAPLLALVERLERLVSDAPEVPLVGQARIDVKTAYELVDQIRATLPEVARAAEGPVRVRLVGALPFLDELDDSIHKARPVPLTNQVRVDRGKLSAILQRIRAAFSQGTLLALTN